LSFYFLKKYTNLNANKILLVASLSLLLLFFSWLGVILHNNVFIPYYYNYLEVFISNDFQLFINSFMDKIFIVGVAVALKQYSVSQQLRQREQVLINEKREAELNFLKSQINPHFLFNTLNNIYSLARKKSDKTPEVVLKLSKLLRFVLYETENKKIAVSREIQFITDYIELEKIRYDDKLKINFDCDVDDFNSQITPLLLIPLVENAFKHGASEAISTTFINITFEVKKDFLIFTIENSVENNSINYKASDGIGLQNLKRQLEIIYPSFDLEIIEENFKFRVNLKLDLK
jgi:two-component system, LytTR family, sensor kinase